MSIPLRKGKLFPGLIPLKFVQLCIRIVPVTLVMGTIFLLSHQTGDSIDLPSFPGADKVAHMMAYGALALSLLWYFGKKGAGQMMRTALFTVALCLLYGVSDEFHQSFIPLRSVSALDIVADTAGASIVAFIWFYSAWVRRKISVM
jgi:hypothetical protein